MNSRAIQVRPFPVEIRDRKNATNHSSRAIFRIIAGNYTSNFQNAGKRLRPTCAPKPLLQAPTGGKYEKCSEAVCRVSDPKNGKGSRAEGLLKELNSITARKDLKRFGAQHFKEAATLILQHPAFTAILAGPALAR